MGSLTVWARPGLPPRSLGNAILWEAFLPDDAPPDWVSLPEFVHRERENLRTRYQSWLSGISQGERNGVAVAEFMSIRSNLSYWWMSLPTDNSLAADSPAYRVLRLFALTTVAEGMKFDHVKVVTLRRDVAEAVALWADSIGKPCKVDFSDPSTGQPNSHERSRGPILAALGVFWNHLLISIQSSRKVGRVISKEGIVFIDYLAHLQEPGLDGAFRSNYWGPLVELLEVWPEPVNWLHISAHYATPTVIRSDVDKCKAFNAVHPAHSPLHAYLGLRTISKALRDYARIRRFGKKLRKRPDVFVETGTRLDPSPLLHELIQDQYFGRTAALNAFWISLWERAIHGLPRQRLGVYLYENQPWELAFLSAWQRSHFGKTFAVAHTTMRFWDLRYFPGDTYSNRHGKPAPNSVVINGPLMKATALSGGYPERQLMIAETLRFQTEVRTQNLARADLLVLGEYEAALNEELITTAKKFLDDSGPVKKVVFRPHPSAEGSPQSIPRTWSLDLHTPVSTLLADCRFVLCGPTTSASLDARRGSRSVLIYANPRALLSSPVIGLQNVYIIFPGKGLSSQELKSLLGPINPLHPEPITVDPQLTRWLALLR